MDYPCHCYIYKYIYIVELDVVDPNPCLPTHQNAIPSTFSPCIHYIYISVGQVQRTCKILKKIMDSNVHILRAYENQRFCSKINRNE